MTAPNPLPFPVEVLKSIGDGDLATYDLLYGNLTLQLGFMVAWPILTILLLVACFRRTDKSLEIHWVMGLLGIAAAFGFSTLANGSPFKGFSMFGVEDTFEFGRNSFLLGKLSADGFLDMIKPILLVATLPVAGFLMLTGQEFPFYSEMSSGLAWSCLISISIVLVMLILLWRRSSRMVYFSTGLIFGSMLVSLIFPILSLLLFGSIFALMAVLFVLMLSGLGSAMAGRS